MLGASGTSTATARAASWLSCAVALAAGIAQLTVHRDALVFESEHDWLLGHAAEVFERVEIHSSPIGPTGFDHGPLFFLLAGPLVRVLSGAEPLQIAWVLLASLGAWLLGAAVSKRHGALAGLATTCTLVGSWFWYETCRQLWHSSLLPLPVALFLSAAWQHLATGRPKHLAVAGLAAAVSVQLHAQTVGLGVLTLALLVRSAWRLGWRPTLGPALVSAAALGPAVLSAVSRLSGDAGPPVPAGPPSYGASVQQWLPALVRLGSAPAEGSADSMLGLCVVLLAVIGLFLARRDALLVAMAALGLGTFIMLVGWSDAPRYLHAVAYPLAVAAGVAAATGLPWLLERARLSAEAAERSTILLLVCGAAWAAFTPARPDATPPLLSARAQARLAVQVAEHSGEPDGAHGWYLNDRGYLIGLGWFHDRAMAARPGVGEPRVKQLGVFPPEVTARVANPEVVGGEPTPLGPLQVVLFDSAVASKSAVGRTAELAFSPWVRRRASGPFTVDAVVRSGRPSRTVFVHIRRQGEDERGCTGVAEQHGRALPLEPIPALGRTELYGVQAAGGALTLRFAPCEEPLTVGVF